MEQRHKKHLAVMRGWLHGKGYFKAAEALEIVCKLEVGYRKDGKTPKPHHQLAVARLVATLSDHLLFPEESLTVAFLHDVLEDHHDSYSRKDLERLFGQRVADAVWAMSKKSGNVTKPYDVYFSEMAEDEIASVVKMADRIHNIQTMYGVFSKEKQSAYICEVGDWFLPMVKKARRNFPRQLMAYENLKITMRCQCSLVRNYLEVA